MKKKLLALIVAAVMVLSMLPLTGIISLAEETLTLKVEADDVTVTAGQEFTVTFRITENTGFVGMHAYLECSEGLTIVETNTGIPTTALSFLAGTSLVWDGLEDYTGTDDLLIVKLSVDNAATPGTEYTIQLKDFPGEVPFNYDGEDLTTDYETVTVKVVYEYPTEYKGTALDWSYKKNSIVQAEIGSALWLQIVYSTDAECPEWAWQAAGLTGAPDVSTWYGTDGTDGTLSSFQALEGGGVYQLQNSLNIWPAFTAAEAKLAKMTAAEKAGVASEIGKYEAYKTKALEILGNVNGVYSEGVTADSPCTAVLKLAEIVNDLAENFVHVMVYTLVEEVPATCTTEGVAAHYIDEDGNLFADENGTQPVSASDLVIPMTEHVYDKKVATADYFVSAGDCYHGGTYYYSCTCGACGTETFKSARVGHTYDADGVCTVCGAHKPTDYTLPTSVDDTTFALWTLTYKTNNGGAEATSNLGSDWFTYYKYFLYGFEPILANYDGSDVVAAYAGEEPTGLTDVPFTGRIMMDCVDYIANLTPAEKEERADEISYFNFVLEKFEDLAKKVYDQDAVSANIKTAYVVAQNAVNEIYNWVAPSIEGNKDVEVEATIEDGKAEVTDVTISDGAEEIVLNVMGKEVVNDIGIGADAIAKIADATTGTTKGLAISLTDSEVLLDAGVLDTLRAAGGDVELKVDVADATALNPAQTTALGTIEAGAVINIDLTVGGDAVHTLNGTAMFAIPDDSIVVPEGKNLSDAKVYYVDDEGNFEERPTQISKGAVFFTTTTCSTYVVLFENPITSDVDMTVVIAAMAIFATLAVAAFVCRKKFN